MAFTLDSVLKELRACKHSCEPLCGRLGKAKLLLLRSHHCGCCCCCSCCGAAAGATIMFVLCVCACMCVSVYVCKCLWAFRCGWQRAFSRADFAYFPRLLPSFSPPTSPSALLRSSLFVALSVSVFCRPCAQLSARFALRVSHANINKHSHTRTPIHMEYEHSVGSQKSY